MFCYVFSAIIALIGIFFIIASFTRGFAAPSNFKNILTSVSGCCLIMIAFVMCLQYSNIYYKNGISAYEKLESGNYNSSKQIYQYAAAIKDANNLISTAKENPHPFWDSVPLSKYSKRDYINLSDSAKEQINYFILHEKELKVKNILDISNYPSS